MVDDVDVWMMQARDERPTDAVRRWEAIARLRAWLTEQERRAVVIARLTGWTWADIGEAAGGLSRRDALRRWGDVVATMEATGLLRPSPPPGPPAEPIDPTWAEQPGRPWCRWCGQRVGMPGGGQEGWRHCLLGPDGLSLVSSPDLAAACPGPEPWPAGDPWPDGPLALHEHQ